MSSYLLSILVEAKDEASSVLGGIGSAIAGVGKVGLAVAGAGVAALGGALVAAVGNAIDAQDVFAQTEAVIKSTGGAAGLSAQELADLASSLSAAAGASKFGDEAILQGENLLATFTNIGKDVFPQATQTMVDMAQAMGTDVKGGAIQLGKALNDPVAGISALSRVGVTFTDEQKKVIKRLVETGDVAGAQKVILAELAKEFGGSAAAAAQTFSGQLGTLKDKFGELLEGIGLKLLPLLTSFVGFLNSPEVQTGIQSFADGLVNGIGQAATFIGPILAQLGPLLAGAFQVFTTQILPTLLGLWQQLQAGLAAAQPLFAGAAAAVQPLIATFTDAANPVQGFVNVLTQISPVFAVILGVVQQVMPTLRVLVGGVLTDIVGYFQQHGAGMVGQVQQTWQTLRATIASLIGPIVGLVQALLAQIMAFWNAHGQEILLFLGETWAQINSIIQIALELLGGIVSGLLLVITGFINAHGTEIQNIFTNVWTIIRNVIGGALEIIRGILTAALAVFKGDWSGAWSAIQTMSVSVTQRIWQIIKAALDLIANFFGTSLAGIAATWSHNWEAMKALFILIWDSIKAYFQGILASLVGWVLQTMEGIKNAIVGFAGAARSAAGGVADAIVSGIADGISNGASAIVNAAKDAAFAALDAAKAALGIASPSKLFRAEVGAMAGQGMALGITDTIPNVTKAAADMGMAAVQGTSQVVQQTQVLHYTGIHHDEQDVRQALRTQALAAGWSQ